MLTNGIGPGDMEQWDGGLVISMHYTDWGWTELSFTRQLTAVATELIEHDDDCDSTSVATLKHTHTDIKLSSFN